MTWPISSVSQWKTGSRDRRHVLNIGLDRGIRGPPRRHPPGTEAGRALQRGFGNAPKPNRDGPLNGQRIKAGIVDDVVGSLVCDQRLSPELAQHLDLFFSAAPARLKFLTERVVLDVIPANPDAEA